MKRAVFWDRDGTLMEEVHYCRSAADVKAVAGAGTALAELRAAGWLNIVVTNQSGIARGYFSVADYEAVNAELFRQLGLVPDGVYFAPDDPAKPSPRRKPGIGMLEEARADLELALEESVFVGDKSCDIDCGRMAGCRTILVRTGHGLKHLDCRPDAIAADAAEAARIILAGGPARRAAPMG